MTRVFFPTALAMLVVSGCVDHSHVAYFDDHAFYSVRQHYRIRYAPEHASVRALLGAEWRPLNIREEHGLPSEGTWGRDDRSTVRIDHDGDFRDDVVAVVERFDLRFEHRQNGASLTVRTTPMPASLGERTLDVLVHDLLERVAGGGPRVGGPVQVASILYEGHATVGGADAYQAIFEGAALGPSGDVIATSTDRAYLVLVRPPSTWYARAGETSGPSASMIVSFWLVARREHFDGLVPALRSLLDRTDFHAR